MRANTLRRVLRHTGYEVTRYPTPGSLWETLLRLFDRSGVNCVIDVGAHTGEYGAFLREHGYRGEIRSFEPIAESARELSRRAESDPLWTVDVRALGSEAATRPIRVARASTLTSFLTPSEAGRRRFGSGLDEERVHDVEVVRLDDVFDAHDRTTFLKSDTQGFDLEVVRGAGGVIDSVVGVQLELDVEPLYAGAATLWDGLAELRALGFAPAGFWPVARGEAGELLQVDVVVVRP